MSSAFKFGCPSCGQHIRAYDEHVGSYIECPACHQNILVPDPLEDPTSRDKTAVHKLFSEEEQALIQKEGREIFDLSIALTHRKYWQFILLAEMLRRGLTPLRATVLDLGRQQAVLPDMIKDHEVYAEQIRAKTNEYFGILYVLYDCVSNHLLQALEQDSATRVIACAHQARQAIERLQAFHLSIFTLAFPRDYPYPEIIGVLKGWTPFAWQGLDQLVNLLLATRVQRRLQLHEQLLQVSFAPPTIHLFFHHLQHLPKRITFAT